jgi:hypothetical protein
MSVNPSYFEMDSACMASLYFYSRGRVRYQVLVNDDGSIKVHWGDWLSKYAVAIYGTPFRVQEFARMGPHGLLPIKNLNMIYAGEKLYHSPTFYASKHGAAVSDRPAPPLPLTDADKERLALEHIVHEFHLKGDDVRVVSEVFHYIGATDDVVQVAECILDIAGKEIATMATVGLVTGALAALCTAFFSTLQLIHKLETGDRIYQMAAIAVGITAWAYGEGPPPFRQRSDVINLGDRERQTNAQAWQVGCNQALDAVKKMLDTIESDAKANPSHTSSTAHASHLWHPAPGRKSIPHDLAVKVLQAFLWATYGQPRHRTAFALAKLVVESREEYEERELRPEVLHVATTYFNPGFNYHDLE